MLESGTDFGPFNPSRGVFVGAAEEKIGFNCLPVFRADRRFKPGDVLVKPKVFSLNLDRFCVALKSMAYFTNRYKFITYLADDESADPYSCLDLLH